MRYYHAYCRFCRSPQYVYLKQHATFINWIVSVFVSILVSFLLFQDLDLRALLFLGFFIGLSEIFIHLRWRMSLVCNECGFDPFLYKKSQSAASERVRVVLEKRNQKPENWLKPPLQIPIKIMTQDKKIKLVSPTSLEFRDLRRKGYKIQNYPPSHQGEQKPQESQPVTLSE